MLTKPLDPSQPFSEAVNGTENAPENTCIVDEMFHSAWTFLLFWMEDKAIKILVYPVMHGKDVIKLINKKISYIVFKLDWSVETNHRLLEGITKMYVIEFVSPIVKQGICSKIFPSQEKTIWLLKSNLAPAKLLLCPLSVLTPVQTAL